VRYSDEQQRALTRNLAEMLEGEDFHSMDVSRCDYYSSMAKTLLEKMPEREHATPPPPPRGGSGQSVDAPIDQDSIYAMLQQVEEASLRVDFHPSKHNVAQGVGVALSGVREILRIIGRQS